VITVVIRVLEYADNSVILMLHRAQREAAEDLLFRRANYENCCRHGAHGMNAELTGNSQRSKLGLQSFNSFASCCSGEVPWRFLCAFRGDRS
jgi:hypothetical protein